MTGIFRLKKYPIGRPIVSTQAFTVDKNRASLFFGVLCHDPPILLAKGEWVGYDSR